MHSLLCTQIRHTAKSSTYPEQEKHAVISFSVSDLRKLDDHDDGDDGDDDDDGDDGDDDDYEEQELGVE